MNCRDYDAAINALARGRLLEASLRAEALAHAGRCENCAAKLAAQSAVAAGVRAVAESIEGRGASAHVEHALRGAFREHNAAATFKRRHFLRLPRRVTTATATAAAMILFLIALSIGLARRDATRIDGEPAAEATTQTSAPAAVPEQEPSRVVVASVEGVRQSDRPRRRTRTRRVARRNNAAAEETATDFFLLEDENQHVPLESGQVVRVELPLSALIPAEAQAGAEATDKFVKADVVIGQDGLARAIRFVR